MIRHLSYEAIDQQRWDACIDDAAHPLVYAYSFYLNAMAGRWNALVLNDYEAVMPIPCRKKLGIQYVYQPAFIQQLGIFGHATDSPLLTDAFIQTLMHHYRFAECTLNFANPISQHEQYEVQFRNNYIKNLHQPEPEFMHSSPYMQKRYRRAKKNELTYEISYDYASVIVLYKSLYHKRLPAFSEDDFRNFHRVCAHLQSIGRPPLIRLCKQEGSIVAALLLIEWNKRLYNLVSCLLPEGKKRLANYYLYGKCVEEFSGHGYTLDLEGSDEPGIGFFYEKLSDQHQPYPFIRFNHLPIPLRWFK
ncbi:MAG TPA: GNAT family N-acetyltransferase [Ferruginibacter sp.]|nr:GNAT family N-acetyltransferase [Ferruginibacter sp.]HRO06731.1 GNAT family N-acetyltransferase [Ferruginibacter sp.]HRO96948.1 GNAT family N-acetyltransferase [Ferruginibacter sp.]HRP50320.1 GNAT family N-acetyltransferase [Ferruginibacter sp.]